MVILAVIFAIFFCGINKNWQFLFFFRNLHLLSFPTIYSLPCFPLKWRTHKFFPRGHGRTPVKVRSNLKEELYVIGGFRDGQATVCELSV